MENRELARSAAHLVKEILTTGKKSDKVFEIYFSENKGFTPEEKGELVDRVYDGIRWWRLMWELEGCYPPDANVNYSTLLKQLNYLKTGWPENIKRVHEQLSVHRAVRLSVPDWLDELGFLELGVTWETEMNALNWKPSQYIRINTLKTNPRQLMASLKLDGILLNPVPGIDEAFELVQYEKLFKTTAFQQGWFEMQDTGSQLISRMLEVQPGMRVIDGCAGNGGKTLHLASLMKNKGKLIALDTTGFKLENLKIRAERAEISIIETRQITTTKVIKRLAESADRVLLDVPCTGIGVLRRNPEIKWRLAPEDVERLKITQTEILSRYSKMVKKGGKLVYSTCSIFPSENQVQVQKFLAASPDFELEREETLFPSKTGFDGFYMALIRRK